MDNSTCSSEQEDAANRCRWFRINWKWCKMGSSSLGINIRLNPVVSLVSALIIWGFVAWCIIKPETANSTMAEWKTWITATFTWMYIGTQDAWAVFIIVLYFSKYGNMKLGKPDEKPEFKDATYFTMLFAAGIGIGLFYFGVGMFTAVIIVVSTILAIIPRSTYFKNLDFVKRRVRWSETG